MERITTLTRLKVWKAILPDGTWFKFCYNPLDRTCYMWIDTDNEHEAEYTI